MWKYCLFQILSDIEYIYFLFFLYLIQERFWGMQMKSLEGWYVCTQRTQRTKWTVTLRVQSLFCFILDVFREFEWFDKTEVVARFFHQLSAKFWPIAPSRAVKPSQFCQQPALRIQILLCWWRLPPAIQHPTPPVAISVDSAMRTTRKKNWSWKCPLCRNNPESHRPPVLCYAIVDDVFACLHCCYWRVIGGRSAVACGSVCASVAG